MENPTITLVHFPNIDDDAIIQVQYWKIEGTDFRIYHKNKHIFDIIRKNKKRIEKIIKRDFIYKKMEEIKSSLKEEKSLTSIYFQAIDFLKTEDGKLELENYKNSQEVVLTKIDEDFLLNYKVN